MHNPVFPYDLDLGNNPRYWPYVPISGGVESWENIAKEYSERQKEYMGTQFLSRNDTMYDFTAPEIGYDKTRVESVATWKTKGTIEVRKRDASGVYWSATFFVNPMAADASLKAKLEVPGGLNYKIEELENQLVINIDYGAEVENLSGYAQKDDVKMLRTELWINNHSIQTQIASKEIKLENEYRFVVDKGLVEEAGNITIPVKCIAMLSTYFQKDLPLYDEIEYFITITSNDILPEEEIIEPKEDIVHVNNVKVINQEDYIPAIVEIKIMRVSTDNKGKSTYVNLLTAKRTGSRFISAGQVIYIQVKAVNTNKVTLAFDGDRSITTLDELTKQFEWTEPKERNSWKRFASLKELESIYHMPLVLDLESENDGVKTFSTTYVIPYQTKQTLHSWNTLREKNRNAFEINEKDLFTRMNKSYQLVFKASSSGGTITKRETIDVFEAWNTIYNRDISSYVY